MALFRQNQRLLSKIIDPKRNQTRERDRSIDLYVIQVLKITLVLLKLMFSPDAWFLFARLKTINARVRDNTG